MSKRAELPLLPSKQITSVPKGKNYLLIIAVDKYNNHIKPLNNAVYDAIAFRDCLKRKYQFQEETIELLNERATRSALMTTFDDLIEKITEADNLVFYFAGHGKLVKTIQEGYWLLSDAVSGKRDTFFPNYEVHKFIKNLKARHVFGVVDSCFSGTLFRSHEENLPSNLYHFKSRYLLTAGRHEPVEDGVPGEHSPFSNCLLELLQNNPNPFFWVGDLCRSVLRNIRFNVENQTPRGEPLQRVGHQGGEFLFIKKGNQLSLTPIPKEIIPTIIPEKQIFKFIKKEGEKALFIVAAIEDELLKKEFQTHLSGLQYSKKIMIWDAADIPAGMDRDKPIKSALEQADITLLLISSNLINSKSGEGVMEMAFDSHKKRSTKVIPIYLRPCLWRNRDLAKIQGLPRNTKPITQWNDRDEAWVEVIQELDRYV